MACYLQLQQGGHLLLNGTIGALLLNVCADTDTHDGGWSERDYRRYRNKLEQLAKAGDRFNESKYIKEANKVVEIIQEIEVQAPVIGKVASKEIELNPKYFEYIQEELQVAIDKINAALEYRKRLRLEELEDEQTLMMLL